jgi:ABC-2 type transport system permease protein
MTTVATASHHRATGEVAAQPVALRRVIASEWIKFITLRSTVAVLAAAMLGMVIIGSLVGYNTRHVTANIDPNDLAVSATLQGYYLGQLLIGALGVLFVTGEYATGMIRATFVAVPRRLPVLVAKLAVFTTVTLVGMVSTSVLAFLAGQAVISSARPGLSLSQPTALRIAVGTGVYLTLVGLIGMAIGWIVRSTPGALVTYLGVILIAPVIIGHALGKWGQHVAQYLPSQAGGAFITSIPDGLSMRPWPGIAVMLGWVVAILALGVWSLQRRDT